ncbi:hypothetical protein [Ignicoccus hospitalis]|uniref:Uncharacterized protein n=1 Tax=Ignicoccus hospitalis (strain KIN4/I / DSM 18386 / JCM 14125) TaxID=453591 RepID=A8A9Y6_IGNH4|nr:hypothetical protein [Ignicoccus hospitalis]ABU81738.1 hypothetical protein Igni_0556 [Ignicoccus hospitalis KIN4/I]HIH90003.1 hypothetical protein [Desulfurococcaceae archaeon]
MVVRALAVLALFAAAAYAISCEDIMVGIKVSNETGYYYYYFSPHSWQKVYKLVQIEGGKKIERARLYITLINESEPTPVGRLVMKPADLRTVVGAWNVTEAVVEGEFRYPSGTLVVCLQQGEQAYVLIQKKGAVGWWVGAGKTVPIMATKGFSEYEIELQGGGKVFFMPDGAVGESGVKLVPVERGGGPGLLGVPSLIQMAVTALLLAAVVFFLMPK